MIRPPSPYILITSLPFPSDLGTVVLCLMKARNQYKQLVATAAMSVNFNSSLFYILLGYPVILNRYVVPAGYNNSY